MNDKAFEQFPKSFQLAQRSMLIAITIPFMLRWLLRLRAGVIQWIIWGSVGVCALVGLAATYYVVICYPYIGLVDAKDGDLFSKYVVVQSKWVWNLAKAVSIVLLLMLLVVPALDRVISPRDVLMMLYVLSVLFFVVFLSFWYDRFLHPTTATFLRCSLGVGIVFFPLFLPAILIGSYRAKRLLEIADRELEMESRWSRPEKSG